MLLSLFHLSKGAWNSEGDGNHRTSKGQFRPQAEVAPENTAVEGRTLLFFWLGQCVGLVCLAVLEAYGSLIAEGPVSSIYLVPRQDTLTLVLISWRNCVLITGGVVSPFFKCRLEGKRRGSEKHFCIEHLSSYLNTAKQMRLNIFPLE